jgi:Prokaryotic E2 family E
VIDRRIREIELVEARFGELDIAADRSWLIIRRYRLPRGWNEPETQVLILIPPGYPQTPPDNFYADLDLRLAGEGDRRAEGGTDGPTHEGRQWQQFSWHFVETAEWQPHTDIEQGHNLLTFLDGVEQRLSELS